MKKFTRHVDIGLIIVLILLGLHCFALHKRIQYLEEEIIIMHKERMAAVAGFSKTLDEVIEKYNNMNDQKGNK